MAATTTLALLSPLADSPIPPPLRPLPAQPFLRHKAQSHLSPCHFPLRLLPRCRRPVVACPATAAASSSSSSNSCASDAREAERAVVELLREHGASPADATAIAVRAPGYAAMLADGVRELDELGLWESRDRGVVPLLESIGVRLSSAKLIAPYVSGAGLPVLIDRIKFLKEILFSSNGYESLISRNAKHMMMHFSIPADEPLQSTLSFFEKMEARYGGLNMLGHGDVSFPYLIESFPMLLLCSEDNHLKPLIDFLLYIGIPKPRIASVLLSFPPIILSNVENDIKPRINAWEKISSTVLGVAVRSWPHVLGCSTKRMNSIMELFDDLGISKKMLVPVVTSSPQLLLRKPNEFLQIVLFFKDMGLDEKAVAKILCRSPEIFASCVDKTLKTKINFLIDFGVSKHHIPRIIRKYPELLLLDINRTLLPRINYLLDMGLSKKNVCSMIYRFSPLLGYSIRVVMKPKLEFLLRTMRKPLKSIVEYPRKSTSVVLSIEKVQNSYKQGNIKIGGEQPQQKKGVFNTFVYQQGLLEATIFT
ncbi:hypothetical protein GUJ93_ZPchr0009g2349 [Zizania palustris]|uniref:Uncharacterized protein n=1 Tax=Zizania palustris TaxID=103762 RepID=A0A8J5RN16_ZIZPA|nr:hypothetical protein GUJ93_ZPchr0009g2349 [Zizania palustris]